VVLNLIKVHCDPGNLVIVLGASNEEELFFISELETQGVTPLPKVITAEVTNNERYYFLKFPFTLNINKRESLSNNINREMGVYTSTSQLLFREIFISNQNYVLVHKCEIYCV
jgi:hypothetical protein